MTEQFIVRTVEDFNIMLPKWLQEVIRHHYGFIYDALPLIIQFHTHIYNRYDRKHYEIDLVVKSQSPKSSNKTIGFELKRDDFKKACEQAILRRRMFTFFYIVMDKCIAKIIDVVRHYRPALEHGIGIVSSEDDTIIVYSKAGHNKMPENINTILQYIDEVIT